MAFAIWCLGQVVKSDGLSNIYCLSCQSLKGLTTPECGRKSWCEHDGTSHYKTIAKCHNTHYFKLKEQ